MTKLILEPFLFDQCYAVRVCRNEHMRSENATVFFHGFPSRRTKNLDLAQEMCWQSGQDGYIFHYPGLGKSKGPFSFVGSVTKSLEFMTKVILPHYKSINLLGHSWGGLVSLNVAKLLGPQLNHMLLLSPFNLIPKNEDLDVFVKHLMSTVQIDYIGKDHDQNVTELNTLTEKYNPRDLAKNLSWKPGQVTLIQAQNDEIVPDQTTKDLAALFQSPALYEEMTIDHSFVTEREKLYLRMFKAFHVSPT